MSFRQLLTKTACFGSVWTKSGTRLPFQGPVVCHWTALVYLHRLPVHLHWACFDPDAYVSSSSLDDTFNTLDWSSVTVEKVGADNHLGCEVLGDD